MLHVEVLMQDVNGQPLSVAIESETGAAVIARYFDGTWHPVHALTASGKDMPLPECFRMSDETMKALDAIREQSLVTLNAQRPLSVNEMAMRMDPAGHIVA